jgi:hypothetical protein
MVGEHQGDNHVELVSEMMARYPDEWIFFEVVEDDEYGRPHKGRLIAHSPDREEIDRIALERKDVYHIAVWYTGELVPEGDSILL